MKHLVVLLATLLSAESSTPSCIADCECVGNEVICSSVGLSQVPEFSSPESVTLDLSTNEISSISNVSFMGFKKLSTLYLSLNIIEYIDVNAFAPLQDIREIDISNNELKHLSPETFSRNLNLQVLIVSGNPLAYLPNDVPFLVSSTIRLLDLSFCSLHAIYPVSFSLLPNLRILNLESNHLQEISLDTFSKLEHLKRVDLQNNRWSCSCKTKNLMMFVNNLRVGLPPHKPIKCVDHGQYKTFWSASGVNFYCENNVNNDLVTSELKTSTPILVLPDYTIQDLPEHHTVRDKPKINSQDSTKQDHTTEMLEAKVEDWDSMSFWNPRTALFYVVLPLVLGTTVFLTVMLYHCCARKCSCDEEGKCPENADMLKRASSEHIYEIIDESKFKKNSFFISNMRRTFEHIISGSKFTLTDDP